MNRKYFLYDGKAKSRTLYYALIVFRAINLVISFPDIRYLFRRNTRPVIRNLKSSCAAFFSVQPYGYRLIVTNVVYGVVDKIVNNLFYFLLIRVYFNAVFCEEAYRIIPCTVEKRETADNVLQKLRQIEYAEIYFGNPAFQLGKIQYVVNQQSKPICFIYNNL